MLERLNVNFQRRNQCYSNLNELIFTQRYFGLTDSFTYMYVLFLIYDRHSWIQLDFKHIEIFSEIQYIPKPQHQNIFDQNLSNVSTL